ncbi:MAG: hypothetical protein IKL35_05805 [Muribaculaceae bacterium]|nr:hypothetical protein [Muribaculaceae bacterium]
MMLIGIMVNCVMGATAGVLLDVSPEMCAIGANVVAGAVSFIPKVAGCAMEGVLVDVWIGEVVKKMRGMLVCTWLQGIPDMSTIVTNKDAIHLVETGVDPDVLINNTTYPIETQEMEDGDIVIKLDKFQTKATVVTDDELYALSYDKMARVKEAHGDAINDAKYAKAAHAMCANSHTKTTPVLTTSGDDDGTGRKRMTTHDVLAMKAALDKLGVPADGRRLVLCADHVNDLLGSDESFVRQYNIDTVNGKIGRLYGFNIYEFGNTPVYTASGEKKAVGATSDTGEYQCSFAFWEKRVFMATGSTKMYYKEAAKDPQYQQNTINFRHYFLAMPKKMDAGVVMRSVAV